ncbi:Uncharacterised protein, partial [Mycoplasma putrefaciens]
MKIKELQAQTKNLQTITVDTINFKIQELETKIQELKKYEFTKNNRQLAKRDSYIKEVAELNKQIELLKNPKKLDFKIQELQRTINKLKQENANFQSVSIFKKIQYYQIINYITKNKDDLEYDLNLANKYLDKLANIEFKNDFESLILEILTDISKQTKKLDKAKIESLLELW